MCVWINQMPFVKEVFDQNDVEQREIRGKDFVKISSKTFFKKEFIVRLVDSFCSIC